MHVVQWTAAARTAGTNHDSLRESGSEQMLYLNPEFERAWAGQDPFEAVEALEGKVYRALEARKTLRFELNGRGYFAKIHRGVGWREIVKNLLLFRLPVLGATNEWLALRRLTQLGVETMTPVAFGVRGANPANQHSFIVTEELDQTESLEDYCRDWNVKRPPFALKKALIDRVAWMSRQMHEHGINHRDYYICHFLLDVSGGWDKVDPQDFRLSMIDLHRAQMREATPRRWLVKDIGGLYFSAMDIGLTSRDLYRFMKVYRDCGLRETLARDRDFWLAVEKRGIELYRKQFDREPTLPVRIGA